MLTKSRASEMGNPAEEKLLVSAGVNGSLVDVTLKRRILEELKKIWRIAIPGVVYRASLFSCIIVTQMFLGHENPEILSAFAIDQTVILRFVNSIMIGMSSATETLCGQAFGAGQYHMLGICLQRSWIVNAVTVTIFLPLFIFSKQILILLGQQKSVAEASEEVSLWFIVLIYSYVFNMSCQMYLQSQMKNQIIAWVSAPAFFFHVVLSLLLVQKLQMGFTGAIIPLIVANWFTVIGELVYIFGGWCPRTWRGFEKAAFSDLWPVVKLSVASSIMVCLQIWYNAIIVLLAGYMPNADVQISAFAICLNINSLQVNVFLGFFASASVRVSNELGRGDAKAAKFAMKVILITSMSLGALCCIICMLFDNQIAYIFTSSDEVAESISRLALPLAFSMLLNTIQTVLNGIAVGSGLQTTVAFVNLGSFYVIGLPIGVWLSFKTTLKITGLWIGLLGSVSLQIFVIAILLMRIDWDEQVDKASARLNRWALRKGNSDADEQTNK